MSKKKQYAVYVIDAGGWDRDCPDSETVFFGYDKEYVHTVNGGMEPVGHVVVNGYRAAVALRNELDSSGDWTCDDGRRPKYAVAPL